VVSFYTLYYDKPVGKWVIQVCDDTPCCYLGAEELIGALKKELNIREDQTSADGMFTLQRVKCLATCQRAPVVQANLSYFYDVTVERMDAFLRHLREHADSPQAASVSGRYAEDYEPAPDGTFRMMERRLGDVPGVVADPIEVEDAVQRDSAAAMERMQQAARQAGVETQAAAERRAEAESPVEMGPDRSPASAHPDPQRTHGEALPAQSSQREQSHDESAS
jgi:predicted metal-binding protein